jgi:hypothetical protein
MAECGDIWDGPQRIIISGVALCITASGLAVLILGIQAYTSDEFASIAAMGSVESSDAFDTRLVVNAVTVTSLVTIIAGFSGCWGASRENRFCLCSFVTFAAIAGAGLIILCFVLGTVVNSQAPTIAKAINRMCDPTAIDMFKSQLNCEGKPVQVEHQDRLLLASTNISRPQAPMSLVALAFAAEASLPILAARRLFPGTTEESLVVRVCSRLGRELCASPCQLLDLVCQPPPGFNPLTACVCDRSGPRVQGGDGDDVFVAANCPEDSSPLCKTDSTGRHLGVFCQASDFKRPKEEVCFVLPSADCSKTNGMQPVTCSGDDLEPCISNGPCIFPDSRPKVRRCLSRYVWVSTSHSEASTKLMNMRFVDSVFVTLSDLG